MNDNTEEEYREWILGLAKTVIEESKHNQNTINVVCVSTSQLIFGNNSQVDWVVDKLGVDYTGETK